MKTLAILYATREGQTRRIAERMAATLRPRGFAVDVIDVVGGVSPDFDLSRCDATVIAASIHIGKHAPEMVAYVRKHREELARMPTLFLSVSLSAVGAVDEAATAARRESAAANVNKMIGRFAADTGLRPTIAHPVAGALLYRQYGVLVRLMMRFISTIVGASTDTSRNHEYTDWSAIDRFAAEIAAKVGSESSFES